MTRESLVEAIGATKRFGSGLWTTEAVQAASFSIFPGDLVALVGASGSGKSTLLNLIAGLDTPSSGEVCWPALGAREDLRPGKIAIVFQGPSLLTPLSVVENVRLPLLLNDLPEKEAALLADEALDRLHIAHLRDKLPEEISGGQSQRVAIARALASRPALLLADEPTGQLDSATAQDVITTVLSAARELHTAALVATHDPHVARRFPATWQMDDGHLNAGAPCSI